MQPGKQLHIKPLMSKDIICYLEVWKLWSGDGVVNVKSWIYIAHKRKASNALTLLRRILAFFPKTNALIDKSMQAVRLC